MRRPVRSTAFSDEASPVPAQGAPGRAALVLAALGWAASGLAPAAAASQADQDACRPDVFRLCASAIPSEDAIVACLNAHLGELSSDCHAVLAPAPPPSRRRRIGASRGAPSERRSSPVPVMDEAILQ